MSALPPSVINSSGHEASDLMGYHCESYRGTEAIGAQDSGRQGVDVWCPRIFSPVQVAQVDGGREAQQGTEGEGGSRVRWRPGGGGGGGERRPGGVAAGAVSGQGCSVPAGEVRSAML